MPSPSEDPAVDHSITRMRRKRRVFVCIGASLAVLFVLALCVPFAVNVYEAAAERARERALMELPYPDPPVPPEESTLARTERYYLMSIDTPTLSVDSEPYGLRVQVGASHDKDARQPLIDEVMFTLTTSGKDRLPERAFDTYPLMLEGAAGTHAVHSTEWEANQLSGTKEPGTTSIMHFTVPTAAFLDWVSRPRPSGAIGVFRFEVGDEARTSLVELAAALRPNPQTPAGRPER